MMYYPQDSICVAVLINQDVNGTHLARVLFHELLNAMATGIDEERIPATFSTYPNPANEWVTIEWDETTEPVTITLSDLSGRVVHAETFTGSNAKLYTAEYPAGTYLLTRTTESSSSTEKLIIAH